MRESKVILVGAGPGDPELISVKGLKAIQTADVILYDALSSEELLSEAPDRAEVIYVGKRCTKHSLKQGDINALIYQKSKTARSVVRLKGGDPFIFGRGHEEQVYLEKRGVQVEVIPGISSVTSLASLQHVPLTRRGVSESFWVLTGTTKDHQLSEDVKKAVHTDATLVILMATRKLSLISQLLINAGKADIPMMIIESGSKTDEKVFLGSPIDFVNGLTLSGPGIIVIGEVVALHRDYVKAYVTERWK